MIGIHTEHSGAIGYVALRRHDVVRVQLGPSRPISASGETMREVAKRISGVDEG